MIFGGLELVAGGYLVHRHYKNKNEKKRLEDEAEARRHNTFPGAKPARYQQQQQCPQPLPPQYQQPVRPLQKYECACYASAVPQAGVQQQHPHPGPYYNHPRPQPPKQAQTFNIPRRPVPQGKPAIIIQPSLQRTDSFSTLSNMPIANGSRPQDVSEDTPAVLPPRRHASGGVQPATQHGIYGNAGYSVSTPAFGATPTSPGMTYTMATPAEAEAHRLHTVDDNWEPYNHADNRYSYAPTVSTQLGEREPPPPYAP